MAKEKKHHHIFLKILGIIFVMILVLVAVFGIRAIIHRKSPSEYGSYVFDNGNTAFDLDLFPSLVVDKDASELKVMQIADPHLKFGFMTKDRKTMKLIGKAIDTEKPDICVVTGDLTLSVFTYDAVKYFANFMEQRNQYWTFVFGNHDGQFDCSEYTICQILKNYKHCLFDKGPKDIYGDSNFLVNIFKGEKSKENLIYSLVCLDSGMSPKDKNIKITDWIYDWIRSDQMDWYKWAIAGLKEINPDIESSMFFHIPIKEFANMYYINELNEGREIPSEVKDTLPDVEVHDVVGVVREHTKSEKECVYGDDGYTIGIFYQGNAEGADHPDVFQIVKDSDCTKAIFCGHDHVNNLKGYYDGIYLGYGLCSGYHTYPIFKNPLFNKDDIVYNEKLWVDENGNQMEKGVTIIEINISDSYGTLNVTDKFNSVYN